MIDVHKIGILIHMRTTLNIDDDLLARAMDATGLKEKTAVVHAGLKELVRQENVRRLIALGGSDPKARAPERRRPPDFPRS